MRRIITLTFLLALTACSSTPPAKLAAERPSLPAFLAPASIPTVNIEVLDRDLTREVWTDSYRAIVTPLTVPLLARLASVECRRISCTPEQTRRLVVRLTQAFAGDQSCFYFLVSELGTAKSNHADAYELAYQNEDGKEFSASRPEGRFRESSHYRVQRKLLDRYMPANYRSRMRSTLGFRTSNHDIVCGKKIDFMRPFVFHVRPKAKVKMASRKMVWEVGSPHE